MAEEAKKRKRAPGRKPGSLQKSATKAANSSKALVNYQYMQALAHPTRVQLLAILAERMASPKEMSKELGERITQLSYHVKVLRECGLIVEDHTLKRRGALEHFYRSTTPTIIPAGAWDNLPPALRRDISTRIMRTFFEDASKSLEAGAFDSSPGELSWTPLILDSKGVEEMERLSADFVQSIFKLQADASERLQGRSRGTKNATSATVFLASFLSARSAAEGKKASATKRR